MFKTTFIKNNKEALDFVSEVFKKNKKLSVYMVVFSVMTSLIGVAIPLLSKLEIDQLSYKYDNFYKIIYGNPFYIFLFIMSLILAMNLFNDFFGRIGDFYKDIRFEKIKNDFFMKLYSRLQNIEPGYFSNSKNNRIITDSIGDSWFIKDVVSLIESLIRASITLIGAIGVFIFLDFRIISVIAVVGYLVYLINVKKESNGIYDYFNKYETIGKLDFMKRSVIDDFNSIGISGGTKMLLDYIDDGNKIIEKIDKEYKKKDFVYSLFINAMNSIGETMIKIFIGYAIYYSGGSIGLMTMTIMYSSQINSIIFQLFINKFMGDRVVENIGNLSHFLYLTNEKSYKIKSKTDTSKIIIRNLSFNYPKISENELKYFGIALERLKKYQRNSIWHKNQIHYLEQIQKEAQEISPVILDKVDLVLEKGSIYGIVGKNGAGKTTLTNLLLNFYDTYEGSLLFDDVEARELSRSFFFENIGVITQVPFVLKRLSVKENLLMGSKKEYPEEVLLDYLDRFGLKTKVLKMRKGIDSEIGYDSYFSGGEQQLLVLIRLILQDKPILILDEGTNQLDAENEILVMNELLRNKKEKIIIFVTHRMTTIKKADMIFCIENGIVKDSGKHQDLLSKETIYKRLWENQVDKGFE